MTETARRRLRELIARDGAIVCPGVVSPLFATIAEHAGFETVYATGAGISNMWLGMPDLGLMDMTELVAVTGRIADTVSVPVIADIDTGYGNVLNVTRTIREFERAGVAAVQIEDQINPKRCGHFADKAVVGTDEMIERLIAAVDARQDPDLQIIARTDAFAAEGLSSAIERAHRYIEAGADMIFVEAPASADDLRTVGREIDVPMVVNMVEGGKTPILPTDELAEMGYKIVLYANAVMRMAMSAAERSLRTLRSDGNSLSLLDEMVTWEQRQKTVNLNDWLAIDSAVSAKASALLASGNGGQ